MNSDYQRNSEGPRLARAAAVQLGIGCTNVSIPAGAGIPPIQRGLFAILDTERQLSAKTVTSAAIDPDGVAPCEPITLALREHQVGLMDSSLTPWLVALHPWAEKMIVEFKLHIPPPCLGIDPLRRAWGRFRRHRNGFGLYDEIFLDRKHVHTDAPGEVLGTLLHELLHSWQEHHGRPGRRNYHTREYRDKAASLGLIVETNGFTQYADGDTPFRRLLAFHGIQVPTATQRKLQAASAPQSDEASSTLKLWECPCGVKVRIGRSRFNARCLDCDGIFKLRA